jgi:2-polyprenyl-3-methyl-5-hydroxy-6-metoxy-1,4-benzoquinol methylase
MTAGEVAPAGSMPVLWHCPRCRRPLAPRHELLACGGCGADYPVISGIPDLRVAAPAWVDAAADRARARSLLELPNIGSATELAYELFRRRDGWSDRDARHRSDQIRTHPDRIGREFDGWLSATMRQGGPLLDLGCGSGALLAAAARRGVAGVGIDVSLEWLVVAQRIIAENGGRPVLAAAMAEALPLPDHSVGAVISLDVIEHVVDQRQFLREIDRVMVAGGTCALATPNRFSLTPEPHIGVWGVGWVPRALQRSYVRRVSGKAYDYCTLLSARELRRMIAGSTSLRARIMPGIVPPEETAHFSPLKRLAAQAYNRLAATPGIGAVLLPVSPFFRVIARQPTGRQR